MGIHPLRHKLERLCPPVKSLFTMQVLQADSSRKKLDQVPYRPASSV